MTVSQPSSELKTIALLLAIVSKQQEQIASLEECCKELSGKVNMNSRNSSKPPSTDGFQRPNANSSSQAEQSSTPEDKAEADSKPDDKKPNPKSLRQSSGLKPGAQKGHVGCTLKQVDGPKHTRYHRVTDCEQCQKSLRDQPADHWVERQIFEPGAFGHFEVTSHVAEVKICSCGHTNHGRFPDGVASLVQYGPITQAIGVYLHQYQFIPYKRISEFFLDIFGLEVSPGSVCTFQENAYERLESTEGVIREALKESSVLGADETGMRVAGSLWWMHVLRNNQWTLYHIDPSKGHSAIESMGVLLMFAGVLVHDHYKAYFRYAAIHVLCNAHHLRELQGVVDRDCNHLAARLQRLLRLACHLTKGFEKAGMQAMPEVIRKRIDSLFERTARKAQAKEAEYMERRRQRLRQDKVKNTKAFNLFKRLVNFRDETLRFMTDFVIPFDNNGSEQDVRNGKVQQKVSGCFRSGKGARMYARIRSYVSSARKQGLNAFEALLIALKNYSNAPLLEAE